MSSFKTIDPSVLPRSDDPHPALVDVARRLVLSARAAKIVHSLNDSGIDTIVLKGPSTSRRLYPDGGRPYGDIDLLVAPSSLAGTRARLADLGFRTTPTLRGDRPQPCETWHRDDDGTNLDLHWSIAGASVSPGQVWETLWMNSERMPLAGTTVSVLNEPAWAMHLALHAAHHGPDYPVPLEDLHRALRTYDLDLWRAAVTLAGEIGALEAMAAGLRLVAEGRDLVRALGLPEEVGRDVALQASGATSEMLFLAWWWDLPLRERASLLVRKFFPPPGYLRSWSPIANRGPAGLVAAYALRPFWLLFRGFRAARRLMASKRRRPRRRHAAE